MYIWKTKSLVNDIKSKSVSPKEWKKYYLAISILMTLGMYLNALAPRENIVSVFVEAILMIVILIFGISITYQSNQGDDGIDYISRMTALSFPILIKLLLISLLGGTIIGVLSVAASFSEEITEWGYVFFAVILQAIFFWRINIYIKSINA
ncbi:MAG: hypothetical protein ACJAZJ_000087 [Candidatus Endobugula sp.]|jgi:hypothetical protein